MKRKTMESQTEDQVYMTMAVQTVLFQFKDHLHAILNTSDNSMVKEMAYRITVTAQRMKGITDAICSEPMAGDEQQSR